MSTERVTDILMTMQKTPWKKNDVVVTNTRRLGENMDSLGVDVVERGKVVVPVTCLFPMFGYYVSSRKVMGHTQGEENARKRIGLWVPSVP